MDELTDLPEYSVEHQFIGMGYDVTKPEESRPYYPDVPMFIDRHNRPINLDDLRVLEERIVGRILESLKGRI